MAITGTVFSDAPTVSGEVLVHAAASDLWPLISDPLLLAELSDELQRVEWLDGANSAVLGARFAGHNANPDIGEWTTVSTIAVCDRDSEFTWRVSDPAESTAVDPVAAGPIATWSFTLEPVDGGTWLRQRGQMGPGPSGITAAIERWPDKEERIVARRLRQWEDGVRANLAAFTSRAERRGEPL